MNPLVIISLTALVVTMLTSLLAMSYQSGRLSMRVDKLEEWRLEVRHENEEWRKEQRISMDALFAQLRHTEELIRTGDE